MLRRLEKVFLSWRLIKPALRRIRSHFTSLIYASGWPPRDLARLFRLQSATSPGLAIPSQCGLTGSFSRPFLILSPAFQPVTDRLFVRFWLIDAEYIRPYHNALPCFYST
jgi:hypothetical protein